MKRNFIFIFLFILIACSKDSNNVGSNNQNEKCPLIKSVCSYWEIEGVKLTIGSDFHTIEYSQGREFLVLESGYFDERYNEYGLTLAVEVPKDKSVKKIVPGATFELESSKLIFKSGEFNFINNDQYYVRGSFDLVFYDPVQKRNYHIKNGILHRRR